MYDSKHLKATIRSSLWENDMNIGELSKLTGVPTETIRYYEKESLMLPPERSANNYRVYHHEHMERLIFIKNCRAFDMTHEEIHQILNEANQPNSDCSTINHIIKNHLTHLNERIQELLHLQEKLTEIEKRCHQAHTADSCSIIKDIANLEDIPIRNTHLG